MNKSDIESLLEVGERISLECKKSEKGLPKSFLGDIFFVCKYYWGHCAFRG